MIEKINREAEMRELSVEMSKMSLTAQRSLWTLIDERNRFELRVFSQNTELVLLRARSVAVVILSMAITMWALR